MPCKIVAYDAAPNSLFLFLGIRWWNVLGVFASLAALVGAVFNCLLGCVFGFHKGIGLRRDAAMARRDAAGTQTNESRAYFESEVSVVS